MPLEITSSTNHNEISIHSLSTQIQANDFRYFSNGQPCNPKLIPSNGPQASLFARLDAANTAVHKPTEKLQEKCNSCATADSIYNLCYVKS